MKTMAVAKSIITAVAGILLQFSCCSDAGICSAPERLTKDLNLCPQNHMPTSEGDLPCVEHKCDVHDRRCKLSEGHDVNSSSISFTTQMCLTDDPPSPSQVGFMFNWTLLAGQEEVTGLKILVYNEQDSPQIWILLTVNLTGQVDSINTKNFSTDCLASKGVEVGREFFVFVQVLPSEERYLVPDSFTFTHDCSRPTLSERALCPAAPSIRPISKGFCNGEVEVTVNSGFPPGITTETEFDILVKLCPKNDRSGCRSDTKTVQVVLAESEESKVKFKDVKPGVYYAMMAFANEYGLPCDDNFYSEHNRTSVVNKAPRIDLRESHDVCNQTVKVTLLVTSYDQTLDREFNVKVILSGSGVNEGQDLTKTTLITTNPNETLVEKKVYFKSVAPGNYTISTKFEDEYYTKCSSDVTLELTVKDCRRPQTGPRTTAPRATAPRSAATRTPTVPAVKFWDRYGKFILGVGILSIFFGAIAFVFHQRWLKMKRKIMEQQRKLTEDRGSSADGLSSIADTTVQESHLHRFLNDTGRGWSSQIDCTSTELKYSHQPMSADSGVPSDEYETQSWQEENESIAFSV